MKHALAFLGAIVAAIMCAVTGAYVLRHFPTTFGLVGGVTLILLAVAIALPVQLAHGAAALKENVVLVVPVVFDALKGGNRRTDPPASPPSAGTPGDPS